MIYNKMEYHTDDLLDIHRFIKGEKVWFMREGKKYAGIIQDSYYIIKGVTVDERTKWLGTQKMYVLKNFRFNIRASRRKDIGDYIMINIDHMTHSFNEVVDSINGIQYKWDCPVVLGRVFSCVPCYTIIGQYDDNNPPIYDVDNKKGEQYGAIKEYHISLRD